MFRAIISARALLAAGAIMILCGCQWVGPDAINQGRGRYNDIIQSTSMEQMMSNIIRVYRHEPTLFMDVTEVDAAQSFGGSLAGGAANIGARSGTNGGTLAGRVGNVQGTVEYLETPTIRYQPLLGQPLVAQLVTPLDVNSLAQLLDSYWPLAPVMDFGATSITLDADEFYPALNVMMELDNISAIEFVAAKSELTAGKAGPQPAFHPPGAAGGIAIQMPFAAGGEKGVNDSLVVYLLPLHAHHHGGNAFLPEKRRYLRLWARLLRIYLGTQPPEYPEIAASAACKSLLRVGPRSEFAATLKALDENIDTAISSDDAFDRTLGCLRQWIELRAAPVKFQRVTSENAPPFELHSHAPLMRTKSALGILKQAIERPNPKIEFVTRAAYQAVAGHPWNKNTGALSYYTLLPDDEDSVDCPDAQKRAGGCDTPPPPGEVAVKNRVADWLNRYCGVGPCNSIEIIDPEAAKARPVDFLDDEHIKLNNWLGFLRRYILIIVDDQPPPAAAYAAYQADNGRWYYIDGADSVSQRNFHLLLLFMTMMAIPSPTPPLTPTISVGG